MRQIADLHCHILPYVDDGALRTQESDELVRMQRQQGANVICCTPHLRKHMFETPDDEIRRRFAQLLERQSKPSEDPEDAFAAPLRFFLSREYHCDALLLEKLEKGEILPLGEGNYILAEFSYRHSESQIHEYIRTILSYGFAPLIAHLERYPAIEKPAQAAALIDMGALIQVNASSLCGSEGRRQAVWCKKLIKAGLVHVVASDAHDPAERPPELFDSAAFLERKFGSETAEALLWTNPLHILNLDPAYGGPEHA